MSGIKSHGKPSDRMITTCKACLFGIFTGQPRRWRRGVPNQSPGLVHVDCNHPDGSKP